MQNKFRATITQDISFVGIGVHSGKISKIKISPNENNDGIIFVVNKIEIPLNILNIKKTKLCTSLIFNQIQINTIEHLLSALYALEITDVKITVDGNEIPILDGNSYKFFYELKKIIKFSEKEAEYINLKKTISYKSNDKYIVAIPSEYLKIDYIIDYNNNYPNFMFKSFNFLTDDYGENISKARTFGFIKDYEYLKKNNLALGSSYENTLVIDDRPINDPIYLDEPIRHKILDLIGDLSILGKKINAHIIAFKTGHDEHLNLVEKILKSC